MRSETAIAAIGHDDDDVCVMVGDNDNVNTAMVDNHDFVAIAHDDDDMYP